MEVFVSPHEHCYFFSMEGNFSKIAYMRNYHELSTDNVLVTKVITFSNISKNQKDVFQFINDNNEKVDIKKYLKSLSKKLKKLKTTRQLKCIVIPFASRMHIFAVAILHPLKTFKQGTLYAYIIDSELPEQSDFDHITSFIRQMFKKPRISVQLVVYKQRFLNYTMIETDQSIPESFDFLRKGIDPRGYCAAWVYVFIQCIILGISLRVFDTFRPHEILIYIRAVTTRILGLDPTKEFCRKKGILQYYDRNCEADKLSGITEEQIQQKCSTMSDPEFSYTRSMLEEYNNQDCIEKASTISNICKESRI